MSQHYYNGNCLIGDDIDWYDDFDGDERDAARKSPQKSESAANHSAVNELAEEAPTHEPVQESAAEEAVAQEEEKQEEAAAEEAVAQEEEQPKEDGAEVEVEPKEEKEEEAAAEEAVAQEEEKQEEAAAEEAVAQEEEQPKEDGAEAEVEPKEEKEEEAAAEEAVAQEEEKQEEAAAEEAVAQEEEQPKEDGAEAEVEPKEEKEEEAAAEEAVAQEEEKQEEAAAEEAVAQEEEQPKEDGAEAEVEPKEEKEEEAAAEEAVAQEEEQPKEDGAEAEVEPKEEKEEEAAAEEAVAQEEEKQEEAAAEEAVAQEEEQPKEDGAEAEVEPKEEKEEEAAAEEAVAQEEEKQEEAAAEEAVAQEEEKQEEAAAEEAVAQEEEQPKEDGAEAEVEPKEEKEEEAAAEEAVAQEEEKQEEAAAEEAVAQEEEQPKEDGAEAEVEPKEEKEEEAAAEEAVAQEEEKQEEAAAEEAVAQEEEKQQEAAAEEAVVAADEQKQGNPEYPSDRNYLVQPTNEKVEDWKPVEYDTQDGSDDEFEMSTCMAPVYAEKENTEDGIVFLHGTPKSNGEVFSCFEEPNLLYRIINREENTWAFYNDTLKYEIYVEFTFGKHSKIEPLGNTTMVQNEKGEFVTRVLVYPTETEMFVKGTVNGFTSKLRAAALSEDYHMSRNKVATKTIEEEENAIREACGENKNAEEVLKVCIEKNIPFVDPEFPPCQASLDTGAKKPFKTLAWARPKMYLPEELIDQVRLFRTAVKPGSVDAGELGDAWVMCAVSTLSENPSRITGMFRHPEGKETAKKERAVGAYRVTFCKNGQWHNVVVDDYLPISAGKPKYAKSATDPAEIWPCILEKAFAKLHGSYARICIGDPLHALSDMTGFPTYRFDDGLKAASEGDDNLFQDLVRSASAGYTIICSTPGKDPRRCTGGEDAELCDKYRKLGLSTGYAYNILDVKDFPEIETRLVKVRNAVHVDYTWNGEWNAECEKWNEHPEVAEACHFEKADVSSFWMPWKDALNYFDGGGMCFTRPTAFDYRVPCHFDGGVPSVVLEVEVKEPTWMSLVVSQADRRGREDVEYQAVMISVARPLEGGAYKVQQNSSANALRPSSEKWTFLQARDVSLIEKFEAGNYILIPRVLDPVDVPVSIGLIVNKEFGGDVKVALKHLHKDSRVFQNYPKFFPEFDEMEDTQFQKKGVHSGVVTLKSEYVE